MKIKSLKLTNYRNHTKLSLDLDSNVTLITGPNGAGKSNILEAIHLFSTGKSARSKYDRDLIQYNKSFCSVKAEVYTIDDDYELEIQVIINPRGANVSIKKAKINKVAKTMSSITGIFNSVLFSPEDIQLITGSPSERRRYMDDMISQVDQQYKRAISEYTKAVRQRNKLLESINKTGEGWDQVEFYTNKILVSGTLIQQKREEMFSDIKPKVTEKGKKLGGENSKVELEYKKNEISKSRLEDHKHDEIAAMTTLVGPHRDDFEIFLNDHNVSEFGSRGEQRTCVLALKLAEIDYIEQIKGEKPVLLLDDIFSELDEKHQEAVLQTIQGQQTTITSTANPEFIKDVTLKVIDISKI